MLYIQVVIISLLSVLAQAHNAYISLPIKNSLSVNYEIATGEFNTNGGSAYTNNAVSNITLPALDDAYTDFLVYSEDTPIGDPIFNYTPIDRVRIYGDITQETIKQQIPTLRYSVLGSNVSPQNSIFLSGCCSVTICCIKISVHTGGGG